jgi:hypothetical protein
MGLEFGVRERENKVGNGGILGSVMNTVDDTFHPPTQLPNTTTSKCSSIRKCEISPPPRSAASFIAASKMFHESSRSEDDLPVRASW